MVGKDVVWSFQWYLEADTQGRSLGVWRKAMPFAVENYILLEKQLLKWYWVQVKMELLPIAPQLSCPLWANFCWTSQVMNVDGPSNSLFLDRKVCPEMAQAMAENTGSCMGRWPRTSRHSSQSNQWYSLSLHLCPWVGGGNTMHSSKGEWKYLRLVYRQIGQVCENGKWLLYLV